MNLATKKLKDLLPADYNPRKDLQPGDPEYESLKKSIKRWGLVEPIVWNKHTGHVVGGHQRLKVLLAEGVKEAEVVVVDLPEKEEKALNLALNKISGSWDYGKLMLILDEMIVDPPEGMDIETTGFSMEDIAELEAKAKKGQAQEDGFDAEAEALKIKKAETKLGDLWQLGNHRLLCGDATKENDIAKLMDGEEGDLIVTDPPYGIAYAEKNRALNAIARGNRRITTPIKGDHQSAEETAEKLWGPAFKNLYNSVRKGTAFYCFAPQGGDQMMMMMMMMMRENFHPSMHQLIWKKNSPTFSMGRLDYQYQHEPIIYTWKKSNRHFYGSSQTSIIEIDGPRKNDLHLTMKPVELIGRLISNSSQKGAIVLDPFAGSGTTLIAAEQLGRKAYLMEIDPTYCDVIVKRWEKFTGKEARLLNRPRGG